METQLLFNFLVTSVIIELTIITLIHEKLTSLTNEDKQFLKLKFKRFLKTYSGINFVIRSYKVIQSKYEKLEIHCRKVEIKRALIKRMNKALKKSKDFGTIKINNSGFTSSKIKEITQEKTLYRSIEVLESAGFICDIGKNDFNSNVNQEIKRKFVDQNVVTNQTHITEFVLSLEHSGSFVEPPFNSEDIENYMYYPECNDFEGGTEEEKTDFIEELETDIEELETDIGQLEEREKTIKKYNATINSVEKRKNNFRIIDSSNCDNYHFFLEHIKFLKSELSILLGIYDFKTLEELETKIEEKEEKEENLQELNDLEIEYQEIYEWWEVSSYLLRQLKAYGHPVIENECLWGRCTTGQAILLDYAISQICNDMQILEGQCNEWSVR